MSELAHSNELPEGRSGLSRLQGIAVLAAVFVPILAAYVVYYTGVGMPAGTTNEGQLLRPPVRVLDLPFQERDAGRLQLGAEQPRWRYLVIPAGRCASACEKLLYTSRQVHIRLGEKADRVERLLVTAAPLGDARYRQLRQQHPRLRFVTLEPAVLEKLQRAAGFRQWHQPRALLVDQQGYAMMAYDNHHSGNQLLKDIKRLLKYSNEQ
ncbi:hypothetical protein [Microbulbifer sp. SAOS-129_SWC]|uniref:SCO family protein n=1 Tax=Microbulbifer sp. SAOS-129_SWC TaxID=3145235 RepID=UPI003216E0F3